MRLADIQMSDAGRVVVARLTGELDLSNTGNIGAVLAEAVPNSAHALVVDLSEVDYLDSAGIHLIYELRERLRTRGQALRLVIPADAPAHDALRLAGVSGHVATSHSVDAALAELDGS
ncbi:MAG TPA: STAS domain-containing protein [Solirubrobacteraceae bacterium]|nr:STAS domain-containing protein [Solirubrobacteraceae bacterium]